MTENRISVSTSGDRMVIEVYEDDQRIAGAAGKDWADTFAILARGFDGPEAGAIDILSLTRQSVIDLYAAFPDIALDILTARRMFNEEAGELQEAATRLRQLFALTEDESTRFIPDFIADAISPARADVAAEAADALYTLIGLMEACDIDPDELAAAVVAKCAKNDAKRLDNGYEVVGGKITRKVT